ncbi:hypothetical protein [Actinomadura luteofluorescens]|uniref:hypothetical protein n=1 Tax=Actinomadura luteofluorescens TaxID=46163 RepID=UPI003D92AF9A
MKGLTNLLTIIVAVLVGGLAAGMTSVISVADDISQKNVAAVFMLGGTAGALLACIVSAIIVVHNKAADVFRASGLASLGLSTLMPVFGYGWWGFSSGIGLTFLASVLADFVARRAGTVVAAEGPQGQNPKSSGDASQK